MPAPLGNKYAKRPRPASKSLFIRVTPELKAKAVERAQKRNLSFSAYMLSLINADLKGPIKPRKK